MPDTSVGRHGCEAISDSPRESATRLHSACLKRFRGGLVFKAHRLVYHSTLGLRVIKKKEKRLREVARFRGVVTEKCV